MYAGVAAVDHRHLPTPCAVMRGLHFGAEYGTSLLLRALRCSLAGQASPRTDGLAYRLR